ncbi:hypothetical protein CLG96_08010 [Sphingomonas oleivorans]|uniref:Uncharacterized protein n=1 Tax=Sphingomonas oleivorans TaxID=1735121 RepID=A0A2T5FZ22_9SPHN|nr:hypothetical protein [Sphingomonas oleivorans]PTQ11852.1 hypothetical protein CLG96_08010 [Sphingomonas oleivorans]
MLATDTKISSAETHAHKLSVPRLAFTGAVVGTVSFLLCWAVAALVPGIRATHRYIQLFTPADVASGTALAEGFFWSLVIGLITGALAGFAYNLSAGLKRR